jgi:hypothetical protein
MQLKSFAKGPAPNHAGEKTVTDMPFTIPATFRPTLTVRPHQENAGGLRISLAAWGANPIVTVQNEAGTYRIGWLQTVQRIEMKGVYAIPAGHRCELHINFRTPIGDRAQVGAPWYWDGLAYTPRVAGLNPGSVTARPTMADQPDFTYPWACACGAAGGPAPLVEVLHDLSFRTWLVVRDDPPPAAANQLRNVLYNFMYTIRKRFVVDTSAALGRRAATATAPDPPGIERYDPPLPVPQCIWAAPYANNAATLTWMRR